MAIRGLSLAEREPHVLKSDPAHPDNIKTEAYQRLLATGNAVPSDEELAEMEGKVREEIGQPTVFYLGVLTKADRIELGDMTNTPTMKGDGISIGNRRTQRSYEAVRRGLRGWDNFLTEEGRPIPFKEGTMQAGAGFAKVLHDECFAYLPVDVVHELSDAIFLRNGMSPDLEKKSASQSRPADALPFASGAAETAPTN
jgi:hypothetical protein